ncbi:DUF3800 domain-containing protein [Agrococcus sp. Marseille-P2731]|uniref:DUF3800 domain-containing protein n=1 Tax=Agrococcus sp. Marseille-P2731 TaxID=1841862 RepID=UPI0009311366|nr:DUF3800 domain-containing protein [Agrococcus sp. Marseille-P2731]
MTDGTVITIACDESGSEGENLMSAAHPVFVHASVNVSREEAFDIVDRLRAASGSRASELKSKAVLQPSNRYALLTELHRLGIQGNIAIVDKAFYVTAKMVDLLLEEDAHAKGLPSMAFVGLGRELASSLHAEAPAAVGHERWSTVLTEFNKLIRSYARANSMPPTVHPFFDALDRATENCSNEALQGVLATLADVRHHAYGHEGPSLDTFKEMDPMLPTLAAVARTWRWRIGDVPFEFVCDNYPALDERMREWIVLAASVDLPIPGSPWRPAQLRAIRMADSRFDARIQVADILAGVGREISRLAFENEFDDALQVAAHELLDVNVMSSDGSPLDTLVRRRPHKYIDQWNDSA